MQRYQQKYPNASKQEVMNAWKKEREKQAQCAQKILKKNYWIIPAPRHCVPS